MELEYETELGQPDIGEMIAAEARHVLAVDQHMAGCRQIEQPQQIEKRWLARPLWSCDADEFASTDREVDVAHQHHRHRFLQDARNAPELDNRRRAHVAPRMMSTGLTCEALRAGIQAAAMAETSANNPPTPNWKMPRSSGSFCVSIMPGTVISTVPSICSNTSPSNQPSTMPMIPTKPPCTRKIH